MLMAKAAATTVGSAGGSILIALLLAMEAGVPIPVPADLVMVVLGERVSNGALPFWLVVVLLQGVAIVGTTVTFLLIRGPGGAMLERLGPKIGITEERLRRAGDLVDRRGLPAVALGRATPGLRTVTAVATARTRAKGRALMALIVGSTLFVQGHFLLGLALGPAAGAAFKRAGVITILLLGFLLVAGLAVWFRRRGTRAALQCFGEASCPACLALSVAEKGVGRATPLPGALP